jgi:phage host-nuclease inhibitor protein Gam
VQNGDKRTSLSSLAGATTRTYEQVQVPIRSLDDLLAEVRRLGATGKLTLHFAGGAARSAEWQAETTRQNAAGTH